MADLPATAAYDAEPARTQSEHAFSPARDPRELRERIEQLSRRDPVRLGEALLDLGLITPSQLASALEAQATTPSVQLGSVLQLSGVLGPEEIRAGIACHLGVAAVDLRKWHLDARMLTLVEPAVLRGHVLMPIWIEGDKLYVAMSNVLDQGGIDALRLNTTLSVCSVYAPLSDIQWALDKYYLAGVSALVSDEDLERNMEAYAGDVHALLSEPITANDNVIVRLADQIIAEAHRERASDIHIEPMPEHEKTVVRIRVDGRMLVQRRIPWVYRDALVSRFKVMANLNLAEHRVPQDGKIRFHKPGLGPIEMRIAVLPTTGGVEDVVLRILDTDNALPLRALGLSEPIEAKIRKLIEKPYGIFLVCGPTGSGKTTTLHAALRHLNDGSRKIWTVENPVEITQSGLRQVQVNQIGGLTFPTALRAFLRADPDVIMVGEIRDIETAKTAIEASLTGHLVLSTLHTNNAPESVTRLLEMGMDPFNFADALVGILAQRLVRCLCPHCREPVESPEALLDRLASEYGAEGHEAEPDVSLPGASPAARPPDGEIMLYRPRGCAECAGTGYKGRVGLFELLPATPEIKRLIIGRAPAAQLFELALAQGMKTLKQDGIDKVLQGTTDLTQVLTVSDR